MFLLCVSCGTVPVEEVPQLYWPLPPETPRVKFVDLIIGSIDVTGVRSGKFSLLLFGEEPEAVFLKPTFITVKDNVMYVADVNIVHVFDFGIKSYYLLGRGLIRSATGIGVSADGRIYIADSTPPRIQVLSKKGINILTIGANKGFTSVGGLVVDDANKRVIACDTKGHRVRVFSLDGDLLFDIGARGPEKGQFNFPYAVTVDPQGRIYVVDAGNFRVQIFDKEGKFLNTFGYPGAVPGSFSRPKGIALDSEGHIYVVDAAFANFQILDYNGLPLLAVGTGGRAPGQFQLPLDITIDGNDRIYVVDQLNRRIQIFQYLKEERPQSE